MQNIFSGIRNPALRYGLIFGLILLVVQTLLSFVGGALGILYDLIALGAYLVLCLLAGQRASQETGRLRTGVLAGFWAGLISSLISTIISLILTFVNLDALRNYYQAVSNQQHLGIHYDNGLVISTQLFSFAISMLLAILLGLAGGAIGGLMGRNRAAPPSDSYQEVMFEPPSKTTQQ